MGEPRRLGKVAEFDEERGFGSIEDYEARSFFFHCTAIADRTRSIAPGETVTFEVVAGHMGRWEATDVRASRPGP